jgi:CBS domain containing-hemolysin-like protein
VLLIFSALFSGAETAYFSLAKIHMQKLEKENNFTSRRILSLLKKPKQLLITVLLGNTLLDVTSTTLATAYTLKMVEGLGTTEKSLVMTGLIILMTALLLIFGELIPKLYAFSTPVKFAGFTSILLIIFKFIFYPVIVILEWFTMMISKKKDLQKEAHSALSKEDIQNIVQSESSSHLLEENEKRIINSIFRFSTTEVREIMIPRVDIVGVELSSSINEAKNVIIDSGYSRIPVYKKTIDEIVGIVYAKDLILYPEKNTLLTLQRKVSFIPENMKIQALLNQFQSRKKQIAIIVDEYGGTAGLVTLEDILEELVGEIMDEYDDEQQKITKLSEDTYLLSAMIQISEINREFDLSLSEEYDNLAEFLCSELNHIPHKNEKYIHENNVEFIITNIKKQRINFVKMRLLNLNKPTETK